MVSHATPVRGTQSFVHTLSACWRRPGVTALEIAWRWMYGVPAVALIVWQLQKVLLAVTGGTMDPARLGLDRVLLNDPVGALSAGPLEAAGKFSRAIGVLLPELLRVAVWLVPVVVLGWVVASSLGRTIVLRRVDGTLHARPLTLMVLHALRVVMLCLVFALWFAGLRWIGGVAINAPIAEHAEPNLILYCALVIVYSLALFTAWAAVNWIFSVAPLVAMAEDLGAGATLRAVLRSGPLKARLAEVNLVMGIVKIALVVLAMTFSATPLPFEDVATAEFMAWWWAGVTLIYLLWSDFFHVARLVGYLALWRQFAGEKKMQIPAE